MAPSVALYAAVAAVLVYLARDRINPDAIAYIQNARHYAAGRLDLAVNGWFGPLISWLLVPAVWIGGEPAVWFRAYNAVFGVVLAAGTMRLTRRVAGGSKAIAPDGSRALAAGGSTTLAAGGRWGRFVFVAALLLSLGVVGNELTPDLVLAAALAWYFCAAHGLLFAGGTKRAFAVGMLGGLCYLIKGYALVFVAAHLAMTFLLRWRILRRSQAQLGSGRALLGALAAALAGAVLAAAPWVAVLSRQAGQFRISTLSQATDALRPNPPPEPLPIHLLQKTTPGRITNWENPAEIPLPWGRWETRGTWDRFGMILQAVGLSAVEAVWMVSRFDLLGLLLAGWAAGAAVCFLRGRCVRSDAVRRSPCGPPRRGGRFQAVECPYGHTTNAQRERPERPGEANRVWGLRWACLTAALYMVGLLPLWVVARFLWPLWSLLLAVFACVLSRVAGEEGAAPSSGVTDGGPPWRRRLACVLAAALLLSTAGEAARYVFLDEWGTLSKGEEATRLRLLAGNAGLRGAVVTNKAGQWSEDNWYRGLFATYWANPTGEVRAQFLGEFLGRDPNRIAEELRPLGPLTVLIFGDEAMVKELGRHAGFENLPRPPQGKGPHPRADVLRFVPSESR